MWKLDCEESLVPKNWCFELWCWKRLLRVPWTARRSNQSILKEISPGCSLEGMMLKLKLQYFGHLMQRVDSLEKTLMLGEIGGRRRRGQEDEMAGWHHWLSGRESQWTPAVGNGQGGLACCDSWGRKESDTTERLIWSDLIWAPPGKSIFPPPPPPPNSQKASQPDEKSNKQTREPLTGIHDFPWDFSKKANKHHCIIVIMTCLR